MLIYKPIIHLWNKRRKEYLKRVKTPTDIVFFVTNRCNFRCPHCFYTSEMDKEQDYLTIEEIEKFVNTLDDMSTAAITGGEPTLHPKITEVCEIFLRKTNSLFFLTNGSLPDRVYDIFEKLSRHKNKKLMIQLSIDGLESTHNRLRGVDSFRKAIRTIELINKIKKEKKSDIEIVVCTSISKENINEIEQLHKFLSKCKIDEIRYNFVRGLDNTFNLSEDKMAHHDPSSKDVVIRKIDDWEKIYSRLIKLDIKTRLWKPANRLIMKKTIELMQSKKKMFECYNGIIQMILYPDGNCSICEYFKPFGNIRDFNYDARKMFKSKTYKNELETAKSCECVHNCHLQASIGLSDELLYEIAKSRPLKENIKIAGNIVKDKIKSLR